MQNMKDIAQRLKKAREDAGFKRAVDFCEKHDLTYATYIQHENGTRGIKHESLKRYATLLDVSMTWLLTGQMPQPKEAIPLNQRVPLISWVQAGAFSYTGDPKTLNDAEEWLQLPLVKTPSFAIKVKGDSMNNVAPDGTIILVDYEDKSMVDRKLYVFECDGELTFKRYRKKDGKIWLEPDSTNKSHKQMICDKSLRVVGKVFMVLTKI